jgi:lipopolysaccharide biosynthesis glycosyltransferase
MDTTYYDFKLPDQNLLNNYYHNQWIELPIIYNFVVNVFDDHSISKDGWSNDTRVVHFASYPKPWNKSAKQNRKSLAAFESVAIRRQYFAAMVSEYGWKNLDTF